MADGADLVGSAWGGDVLAELKGGAAAVSDELHVGNNGDHGELSRWQAAAAV
jgi:hypothetical protein